MSRQKTERTLQIRDEILEGKTYAEIANRYGVTRQRIGQIARDFGLKGHTLKKRQEKKREVWVLKMREKYGALFDGGSIIEKDFYQQCREKYTRKVINSLRKNIEFPYKFTDIIWNKICPLTSDTIDYEAPRISMSSPIFEIVDGEMQIISWKAKLYHSK